MFLNDNNLQGEVPASICDLNLNWSADTSFNISENLFCKTLATDQYPDCVEGYQGEQKDDCRQCAGGELDVSGECVGNTETNLNLSKSNLKYELTNKKGETTSLHSMYECIDEENRIEYYMIKNKIKGQYLIPEKPSIDYFLFICNNNSIDIAYFINELKTIKSILGAYRLFPDEITSTKDIVFN